VTTMADMVSEVRRNVYGSMTENINLVASTYTSGDTVLNLELPIAGITPGMMISSGLNTWFVKGTSPNENQVFVIPGYDDSPSQNAAVNDFVYIKPRMTAWYAFNKLNDQIKRLSSSMNGLYAMKSWVMPVDSTYQTYVIPTADTDLLNIIRVRYLVPGTPDVWADISNKDWKWQNGQSEQRVQILINVPSGTDIEFVYQAPFTQATSLNDNVQTVCGLSETMLDIPALGVSAALLMTSEARRNQVQTQGDSRRASEVSITGNSMASRDFNRLFQARIDEEYIRLVNKTPIFRGI